MVTGPRAEIVRLPTTVPPALSVKVLAAPVVPSTHITTQLVLLTVAPALGWVMKTLSGPLGVGAGLGAGAGTGAGGGAGLVGAAPIALPLTPRDRVSPSAVKVTFPEKTPAAVGRNLTTTFCRAPGASENDPPEAMENGATTLTAPDRGNTLVFSTVKVRSTLAPAAMLPKLTAAVGVTPRSARATPLAAGEHVLSLPDVSTAVTRTKYVMDDVRPVR
jgi:hypothetical protein